MVTFTEEFCFLRCSQSVFHLLPPVRSPSTGSQGPSPHFPGSPGHTLRPRVTDLIDSLQQHPLWYQVSLPVPTAANSTPQRWNHHLFCSQTGARNPDSGPQCTASQGSIAPHGPGCHSGFTPNTFTQLPVWPGVLSGARPGRRSASPPRFLTGRPFLACGSPLSGLLHLQTPWGPQGGCHVLQGATSASRASSRAWLSCRVWHSSQWLCARPGAQTCCRASVPRFPQPHEGCWVGGLHAQCSASSPGGECGCDVGALGSVVPVGALLILF